MSKFSSLTFMCTNFEVTVTLSGNLIRLEIESQLSCRLYQCEVLSDQLVANPELKTQYETTEKLYTYIAEQHANNKVTVTDTFEIIIQLKSKKSIKFRTKERFLTENERLEQILALKEQNRKVKYQQSEILKQNEKLKKNNTGLSKMVADFQSSILQKEMQLIESKSVESKRLEQIRNLQQKTEGMKSQIKALHSELKQKEGVMEDQFKHPQNGTKMKFDIDNSTRNQKLNIFEFEKNIIRMLKNNNSYYQCVSKNIIPEEKCFYSFRIHKSERGEILIGLIHTSRTNSQNSMNQGAGIFFRCGTGEIIRKGKTVYTFSHGLKAGDQLIMEINEAQGTLYFIAHAKKYPIQLNQDLKDKKVKICIEMVNKDDQVEIL